MSRGAYQDPIPTWRSHGGGLVQSKMIYCTLGPQQGNEISYFLLAGKSTELVQGWGCQGTKDPMVAGLGLSSRHREVKALQEAGEEEEELHAGQGLPQASSAAC